MTALEIIGLIACFVIGVPLAIFLLISLVVGIILTFRLLFNI